MCKIFHFVDKMNFPSNVGIINVHTGLKILQGVFLKLLSSIQNFGQVRLGLKDRRPSLCPFQKLY